MPTPLPKFTSDGLLPPGDYPLSLPELEQSFLVTGTGVASQFWDVQWRKDLVRNLSIMVTQLWMVLVPVLESKIRMGTICYFLQHFGLPEEMESQEELSKLFLIPKEKAHDP